jgi:Rrf2 family protein
MAVHVLAVLAYKEGDRVTSADLAGSVNTNPVIIRRLLLSLQKARLVDTCKGAGSGSRLSRSPSRINMAEIYLSVEGTEPFAAPARKPSADCPVGQCMLAALDKVFKSAQAAMERDLSKTTLADVLDAVKASCGRAGKKAV